MPPTPDHLGEVVGFVGFAFLLNVCSPSMTIYLPIDRRQIFVQKICSTRLPKRWPDINFRFFGGFAKRKSRKETNIDEVQFR